MCRGTMALCICSLAPAYSFTVLSQPPSRPLRAVGGGVGLQGHTALHLQISGLTPFLCCRFQRPAKLSVNSGPSFYLLGLSSSKPNRNEKNKRTNEQKPSPTRRKWRLFADSRDTSSGLGRPQASLPRCGLPNPRKRSRLQPRLVTCKVLPDRLVPFLLPPPPHLRCPSGVPLWCAPMSSWGSPHMLLPTLSIPATPSRAKEACDLHSPVRAARGRAH